MDSGATAKIPANVGTFTTTLQPTEITDTSDNVVPLPGKTAVLAVLMCQGGTPDGAVEAELPSVFLLPEAPAYAAVSFVY
jgi:hypothetical protein